MRLGWSSGFPPFTYICRFPIALLSVFALSPGQFGLMGCPRAVITLALSRGSSRTSRSLSRFLFSPSSDDQSPRALLDGVVVASHPYVSN